MPVEILRIDLGFVNAYLLRTEGAPVLLDCGMASSRKDLIAALDAAGAKDPGLLVLSHADPDHIGNAAFLKKERGWRVAIHRNDAEVLAGARAPRRSGTGGLAKVLMGFQRIASKAGIGSHKPVEADILIEDGDSLPASGSIIHVLHLPGHTPGSIGLVAGDGEFLCGDLLANRRRPSVSPFVHDPAAYGRSLERVKAMAPLWKTVLPGHGSPFPASALAGIAFE